MFYTASAEDVATLATDNLYKTFLLIRNPNTAGMRFRLRRLRLTPADNSPHDLHRGVRIMRIDDYAGGTAGTSVSTISAVDMPKKDTNGPIADQLADVDFSVEPTVFSSTLFTDGINVRGGIPIWWEEEEAFKFAFNQACGILLAPRGTTIARLNVHAGFERY